MTPGLDEGGEPTAEPDAYEIALDESGRRIFLDMKTYEEFSREPHFNQYVNNYSGIHGESLYEGNTALSVDYEVGNGLVFDVDQSDNFVGKLDYNYNIEDAGLLNSLISHRGGGYVFHLEEHPWERKCYS